ncbi:hypothetical protein TWF506_002271 [Arthrobotrys conoides]|uniref:Uncharacterized protein n=1 Tax=Arthrobotrys conoides TaxID=74498 RepID=A0AAN8RUN5_9PEZI
MDRLKGKKVKWERLYRGIAISPSSKGVYFGCAREQYTWLTPHPWFYRAPKDLAFFPDKNNYDDMGSAINGQKDSLETLVDFDWPNTTPGNEVPGDLRVEGVPREEVARALRGMRYEPEGGPKFQGETAPAYDGKVSSLERENAMRGEKSKALGKVLHYEDDYDEDEDVYEDAPETWDDEEDPPEDKKPVKDPPSKDKTVKDPEPSKNKGGKEPPSDDKLENPFTDKNRIEDPFADKNRIKNPFTDKNRIEDPFGDENRVSDIA